MANERAQKLALATFRTLCETLDDRSWHYEKDAEKLSISCKVKGDDLTMPLTIRVNPDKQLVSLYSQMPFDIPENRRKAVAVAVGTANNGMHIGGFDYQYTDGTIVYRITASFRESLLGKGLFVDMIDRACYMIDKYNDKFFIAAKMDMDYDKLVEMFQ